MSSRPALAWLLVLGFAATTLVAALPPAASLPTPGFFCDLSEPVTGRVFPEAMQTNDYVGYEEAKCGLAKLEEQFGDVITVVPIAKSVGWKNAVTGDHDQLDVFAVEVTNEASNLSRAAKIKIVFQLSIHGNEKGGREGGLRVIEDFARGIGIAEERPELARMLDYMVLVFVFPNPDGWAHEEAQYRANDACYVSLTCGYGTDDANAGKPGAETQSFVRVNGNGVDLNRDWPTVGWYHEPYTAMSEPEVIGIIGYLRNLTNVRYASDIHGMLNPADMNADVDPAQGEVRPADRGHFVLTMLPAGRQSPEEMFRSTALAERVKETLNGNSYYAEWQSIPTTGVWGGEFNDWGTVWDTIGYTDSGFTSDWFAQDQGLNAPGVDFELSYNHITFDNYYPGLAQRINAYHVEIVRDIVYAFMSQAALDLRVSIDTKDTRTAYLVNPLVITNADDMTVAGWAAQNEADDIYDTGHVVFEASPDDYFTDLAAFARGASGPAILEGVLAQDLMAGTLAAYDNLVIAGSAYDQVAGNPAALDAVKAWVETGGNLFVSDAALQLLQDVGAVKNGSVARYFDYAGFTNFFDRNHELVSGVRGLARMTYEPVPLGYGVRADSAPIWYVDAAGFDGEAVGYAEEAQKVNFGRVGLGDGRITFLGAFLPDPSTEDYHPYGLDSYATTYTSNQILRNALGWDIVFDAPPVVAEDLGAAEALRQERAQGVAGAEGEDGQGIPGASALALVGALALVAVALRRPRREG